MWSDPYGRPWGERIFFGLLALLAAFVALKVLAALVTPLIGPLIAVVVLTGCVLWFSRRSHF